MRSDALPCWPRGEQPGPWLWICTRWRTSPPACELHLVIGWPAWLRTCAHADFPPGVFTSSRLFVDKKRSTYILDSFCPQRREEEGVNLFDNPPGIRRLAQAVIVQAARDARRGSQEAATWLSDPITADTWLILLDLDRRAVERWVEAGCKNNLSGTVKARRGDQ